MPPLPSDCMILPTICAYIETCSPREPTRIDYHGYVGTTGYRLATKNRRAVVLGAAETSKEAVSHLTDTRTLFNRPSNHCLWPGGGDPVNGLVHELERGIQRDTRHGGDRRTDPHSSGGQ